MYATVAAMPLPDPDATMIIESAPFEKARLEEKLDQAMRMIAAMQQRIESLDATLMRVLMR